MPRAFCTCMHSEVLAPSTHACRDFDSVLHAGFGSLHVLPGMYADLDFEALKSVEELLVGHKVYLAAMGSDDKFEHGVPNAWMASVPGHPFWLFCLQQVIKLNSHWCAPANTMLPEDHAAPTKACCTPYRVAVRLAHPICLWRRGQEDPVIVEMITGPSMLHKAVHVYRSAMKGAPPWE